MFEFGGDVEGVDLWYFFVVCIWFIVEGNRFVFINLSFELWCGRLFVLECCMVGVEM